MIRVLPEEIASKIAAGEVIERPSSVVKELVENSIDAGAKNIIVEVVGDGTKLIRVKDDGEGIKYDEVELAFQRFSTSKIKTTQDLENITSLGFRGEALPSIASVSEVSMTTRTEDEKLGTLIHLKKGKVIGKTRLPCDKGTTVVVRNLFKDFPARLKFLKSKRTELSHIIELVSNFIISFPEISFTLIIDGRRVLYSEGTNDKIKAISSIYGETRIKKLEKKYENFEIEAFIIPRWKTKKEITLFVNRRWVRSDMVNKAVSQAFKGKYPALILNISINPSEIDINIHPQKREVKFRDEWGIFEGVLEVLGNISRAEVIGFLGGLSLRVIGQFQGKYIICEGEDGVYLIDQHAAHERVLYEELRGRGYSPQGLLEPVIFELSPREASLFREHGFEVEEFGGNSFILRAVPLVLKDDPVSFIKGSLSGDMGELSISLACSGAVKAGQVLSSMEMEELIRRLFECEEPFTCPHGRPTLIKFELSELERSFGR